MSIFIGAVGRGVGVELVAGKINMADVDVVPDTPDLETKLRPTNIESRPFGRGLVVGFFGDTLCAQKKGLNAVGVWDFFHEVRDVLNLGPGHLARKSNHSRSPLRNAENRVPRHYTFPRKIFCKI